VCSGGIGRLTTSTKEADFSDALFLPGDLVDFTVTPRNSGTASLSDVRVLDTLNNGWDRFQTPNVSASSGTVSVTSSQLDVTNMAIAAGSSQTVRYAEALLGESDLLLDFNLDEMASPSTDLEFWAEDVDDFQIEMSATDNELDALGAANGYVVSLGGSANPARAASISLTDLSASSYLILGFGDRGIANGLGDDLAVYERDSLSDGDASAEQYAVYASQDGIDFELIEGALRDSAVLDLADAGLEWARYVLIVDQTPASATGLITPGIDVDAVGLINIALLVDNTATISSASAAASTTVIETVAVDITSVFWDLLDPCAFDSTLAGCGHSISGLITGTTQPVSVTISPVGQLLSTGGAANSYLTPLLASGTYAVTPAHPDCSFMPPYRVVSLTTADSPGVSFTATCAAPVCSSFTYGEWSACQYGIQIRSVLTASPASCSGGMPVTIQSCAPAAADAVSVEIAAPNGGRDFSTSRDNVRLQWEMSSNVAFIELNGMLIDFPAGATALEIQIDLDDGDNDITLAVYDDTLMAVAEDSMTITLDKDAPGKVKNLRVDGKDLKWDAPKDDDVEGYRVYLRDGSKWKKVKAVTKRSFTPTGAGTYAVTSEDATGNESDVDDAPTVEVGGTTFVDVPPSHFAAVAIGTLNSRGIVSGRGDRFFPDALVTRAEFAKMLAGAMGVATTGGAAFDDVPASHSLAAYIGSVVNHGWASGQGRSFFPDRPVTRIEAAKMIARAKGLASRDSCPLTDLTGSEERGYACALFNAKIASGQNGKFLPGRYLTRAEAAKMLASFQ